LGDQKKGDDPFQVMLGKGKWEVEISRGGVKGHFGEKKKRGYLRQLRSLPSRDVLRERKETDRTVQK